MTVALIDGDIISYSCAAYNETFGWDRVVHDIDALIKRTLEAVGATDYKMFITGDNNFRYTVDPQYKANRKGKPDPQYRADANSYLVTEYGASVTDGIEADDAMGIMATQFPIDDRVVCSIDKDLKQIEGYHYDWRKYEHSSVTRLEGTQLFYRQLCTGDSADNIPPVGGVGAVKSARLINNLEDELNMFMAVRSLYHGREDRFLQSGRLLHIWRAEDDDWINKYKELSEQAKRSEEEDPSTLQE